MILLLAVMAGIGLALLRGGSFGRLRDLPLRLGWLAVVCLLAQGYVIYAPADQLEAQRPLHAALLMASYAGLVVMVWSNRRIIGMPIIGLGLLLNLTVMAANGGFMPISPEAVLAVGTRSPAELPPEGGRLTRTKDILLPAERTKLWLLSDVIVAPPLPVVRVLSAGDLVVALGALALFQSAMGPRGEKRIREEDEVNAV